MLWQQVMICAEVILSSILRLKLVTNAIYNCDCLFLDSNGYSYSYISEKYNSTKGAWIKLLNEDSYLKRIDITVIDSNILFTSLVVTTSFGVLNSIFIAFFYLLFLVLSCKVTNLV